jgi:hypothetical protein
VAVEVVVEVAVAVVPVLPAMCVVMEAVVALAATLEVLEIGALLREASVVVQVTHPRTTMAPPLEVSTAAAVLVAAMAAAATATRPALVATPGGNRLHGAIHEARI